MDISEELQIDVTAVKKKIDSLRTSFRRECITGMSNDEVYHSKWFAFKSMQFLNKQVEHRKRKKNIASPLKSVSQDNQEDPQVDEACKVFKIIAENKNALTEKNECILFGEYVTTQLKQFDSHTRAMAKYLIQNTLFEAEMDKL
ncbi:MADF domain [Cinara cedri]|uniref:MADF domain n=1 Tax=Cinara cedri TaxID=506608 RepID=A0A5E4MNT1_9HEMI|nr:MADF domain [Cinara cedri]